MNRREHVLNAVVLAVGIAVLLEPDGGTPTAEILVVLSLPLVLGALFPDVDVSFGEHRKTFHNLGILGVFLAWPTVIGNLQFVWLGVVTHYVLDMLGTHRGIALFYPWDREFEIPVGVPVDSNWVVPVTLAVTGVELAAVALLLEMGLPVGGIGPDIGTTLPGWLEAIVVQGLRAVGLEA